MAIVSHRVASLLQDGSLVMEFLCVLLLAGSSSHLVRVTVDIPRAYDQKGSCSYPRERANLRLKSTEAVTWSVTA